MKITQYIEKYMKNADSRKLSELNDKGLKEIIKNTDSSVWTSMEDLFGNLYTNFQSLSLYLENPDLSKEQKDSINKELAKSISMIATIRDYFTEAKQKA
jgi:translation initiation factor 2 alpha subunit (eIF-2alpha)